jgi:hypothetical protein
MKIASIVLSPVFFLITSFYQTKTASTTLVLIPYKHDYMQHTKDSVYIEYDCCIKTINDSIKHYIDDLSNVKTILIAQPSGIINSINFQPYCNMSTLILAGNDDDVLDSVKYDFFENPKLKKIIMSSVYLNSTSEVKDYCDNREFKKYVKGFRPDITVRFKAMGKYNRIGWGS